MPKVEITSEIRRVSVNRGNPGELVTSAVKKKGRRLGMLINT